MTSREKKNKKKNEEGKGIWKTVKEDLLRPKRPGKNGEKKMDDTERKVQNK